MAHGIEITEYPFWTSSAILSIPLRDSDGIGHYWSGGTKIVSEGSRKSLYAVTECTSLFWLQRCDQNSWIRQRASQQSVAGGLLTLFRMLDDMPEFPPPGIGDIIVTGLWTRPFPVQPGEIWQTTVSGLPLSGLTVMFTV